MILIRDRFCPFSHLPGASCLLPGTCLVVRAFPTRCEVGDEVFSWKLHGPVREFTLQQDLEKGCVFIFGKAKEGFFRFRIAGKEVFIDAAPKEGIEVEGRGVLQRKETFLLALSISRQRPERFERLSLGNNKAQDWDLVRRRLDLKEILPVLFSLGQQTPGQKGSHPLLTLCREAIESRARLDLKERFEELFLVVFQSLLVPRLNDGEFQGILDPIKSNASPCFLLSESATLIRSLFVQQSEQSWSLLPCLPLEFESGRFTSEEIEFEWSKRQLRSAVLRPKKSLAIDLLLPKEVEAFRLRRSRRERGATWMRGKPLQLEAGTMLLLDRFQK